MGRRIKIREGMGEEKHEKRTRWERKRTEGKRKITGKKEERNGRGERDPLFPPPSPS